MSKALPNAGTPGKPRKRSVNINLKRSEGQERRVREILEDAKADGLVEVEINGKPISLNSKTEIDKIVEQVLKDQNK